MLFFVSSGIFSMKMQQQYWMNKDKTRLTNSKNTSNIQGLEKLLSLLYRESLNCMR